MPSAACDHGLLAPAPLRPAAGTPCGPTHRRSLLALRRCRSLLPHTRQSFWCRRSGRRCHSHGSHVPWRRWSSRSPRMRRAAGAAAARLGCAAPPEPPLVSHGSSSKPLASDALRCRSRSCLPRRQSTELSSTQHVGPPELSSLARRSHPHLARARSRHRLACAAAAAALLSRCSQLTRWAGGESVRVVMWMDG